MSGVPRACKCARRSASKEDGSDLARDESFGISWMYQWLSPRRVSIFIILQEVITSLRKSGYTRTSIFVCEEPDDHA